MVHLCCQQDKKSGFSAWFYTVFIKASHSIKSTTSELEMTDALINFNVLAIAKNV